MKRYPVRLRYQHKDTGKISEELSELNLGEIMMLMDAGVPLEPELLAEIMKDAN